MRNANKLVIVVSAVMFASFGLTLRSSGHSQNSNRSIATPQQSPSPQPDFSKNTWELPEDADKTKNPVAATPESVTKGKELFLGAREGQLHFLSR